jgi:hypothetical protein
MPGGEIRNEPRRPIPQYASLHAGYFPSAMTNAPPSPVCGEKGRDEGAFRLGSELRQSPLTRIASQSDLSPHAGRGERQRIMRAARFFQKSAARETS